MVNTMVSGEDFPNKTSPMINIWWCPKIGVPLVIIHFHGILYFQRSHFMEPSIFKFHIFRVDRLLRRALQSYHHFGSFVSMSSAPPERENGGSGEGAVRSQGYPSSLYILYLFNGEGAT